MPYSPQSPRRTQRLFWVVIHPNHLCALGGLGGEYFPRPAPRALRRLSMSFQKDLCALRVLRGEMVNMSPYL